MKRSTAKLVLLAVFALTPATLTGCAGLGDLTNLLGGAGAAGAAGAPAAPGATGAGGLAGLLGGGGANPVGALAGNPAATAAGPAAAGQTSLANAGAVTSALPAAPATTTPAAGAAGTTVPAGANADQRAFCQKFLDRVNSYRAKVGSAPAQFSEQLFQGCLQRTPALANGMDNHAGFNVPQDGATGECLASGTDPVQAADMYYSEGPGGGHYELMYGAATKNISAATGLGASVARCN